MTAITRWKELADQLKTFSIWIVSSIIDGIFLALWVLVQWAVNKFIENLELSGIDVWVFHGFQFLLAITTLAPVVLYVYRDVRVKWLRVQKIIRLEKNSAGDRTE